VPGLDCIEKYANDGPMCYHLVRVSDELQDPCYWLDDVRKRFGSRQTACGGHISPSMTLKRFALNQKRFEMRHSFQRLGAVCDGRHECDKRDRSGWFSEMTSFTLSR
jgi:hypothetical protein